jgi:membrane associated rhomboid family serine protease
MYNFRITDVVKHLLIINILMYLGSMLLGNPSYEAMNGLIVGNSDYVFSDWGRYRLAIFSFQSEYFQPFQIVTHLFMHADVGHLFFNMLAIFFFGPSVEMKLGPQRFFIYYFFTGFGAMALHLLVKYIDVQYFGGQSYLYNVPALGASGAVFGVLLGYAMFFPNNIIQLIFPPIALKAKYMVAIYIVMELFLGLGPFNTGVAHFAHLGGALFGFLLILYWRRFSTII